MAIGAAHHEALGDTPRQPRVVDALRAPIGNIVAVRVKERRVISEILLIVRVRHRRARTIRIRQHRVDVYEKAAARPAKAADARVSLLADCLVELAVVRNQSAEPVGERMFQLDRVGVVFRIHLIVRSRPVLAERDDALRCAEQRDTIGILRVGRRRRRRCLDRAAKTKDIGRGRLPVVDDASEVRPCMVGAHRAELEHADAVGLHARAVRIRIERTAARATHVCGPTVRRSQVAQVIGRVASLIGGINLRTAVLKRHDPQRARIALEISTLSLVPLLHL